MNTSLILILILVSTLINLFLFLKVGNNGSVLESQSECVKELQSFVTYKDLTYFMLIVNLFTMHNLDPFIEYRAMKFALAILFALSWTYIIKAYNNYTKRNPHIDHSISDSTRYTLRILSLLIDIYDGIYFFNSEKIPVLKYSIVTVLVYNIYVIILETDAINKFKTNYELVKKFTYLE